MPDILSGHATSAFTHEANPVQVRAVPILSLNGNVFNERTRSYDVYATTTDGEVILTAGMVARHTPIPGDYVVTQADGYVYVNPKDVFERKYRSL